MDERIRQALARDRVIDITTIGRASGQPRRIEMWFHNLDGRVYITGLPGPRDWYANMLANPRFVFHLKESRAADLPARAVPIADPKERRAILASILSRPGNPADVEAWMESLGRPGDLEAWMDGSPLVRVDFDEASA